MKKYDWIHLDRNRYNFTYYHSVYKDIYIIKNKDGYILNFQELSVFYKEYDKATEVAIKMFESWKLSNERKNKIKQLEKITWWDKFKDIFGL